MRRQIFSAALLVAPGACGDNNPDIVGPFTGDTRRYVVDRIALPANHEELLAIADDMDGEKDSEGRTTLDNQMGFVFSWLADYDDLTTHGPDMIASGAIASYVEITANDFANDPRVGVAYVGADGDDATVIGGSLTDGVFLSNRTRTTRIPATAVAYLPVFPDADPVRVPLIGVEIDLEADGNGGFNGIVRGAVPGDAVLMAAYPSLAQMLKNSPSDHFIMFGLWDMDPADWFVSYEEFSNNSLTVSLLSHDITVLGQYATSVAFRVHLLPCETGQCPTALPFDRCHDRIKDSQESGVDCGGGCRGCVEGVECNVADDCESHGCDAGLCRASTCSDGARDGLESDVDCGRSCTPCASGQRCWNNGDCQSAMCGLPCPMTWCDQHYDTCQ